jgi:hypothetical protein
VPLVPTDASRRANRDPEAAKQPDAYGLELRTQRPSFVALLSGRPESVIPSLPRCPTS